MQTLDLVDMRKRPPHRLDVLANAIFGDFSPELFRPGILYRKGAIVYTYDGKGDITVWKCQKTGTYENAIEPGWEVWSIDDIRTRIAQIEEILKNNYDIYENYSYPLSYYIHDVGVRDWERRNSFIEVFNDRKFIPKKNYKIVNERVTPVEDAVINDTLPVEKKTVMYLNKGNNDVTNLVKRIEMEGEHVTASRVKIPFPVDESLMNSYVFDLFVDGVYISSRFYTIGMTDDGEKCIDVEFNCNGIDDMYAEQVATGKIEFVPPVTLNDNSEFIFVFYISLSHDLTIDKNDIDVFIGDARDTKWIGFKPLLITNMYQESNIYNNGIRMRDTEYIVAKDRISVDGPANRFVLGSFATISIRSFNPIEDEKVTNVKQETIPMFGTEMGLFAIPFLNYDVTSDHFLLFNDGGVLLGSQRWFEDNGYINLYDDNAKMQPNEMAEFRMISRDKNMVVTTYILTATMDNQVTFDLPDKLKNHYYHMIFTENGQLISRPKYALSGQVLQIRQKYSKLIKLGERLEVICFDYASEYGFTSLTNYQAPWNKEYVETELDNLPHGDNDEIEDPPVTPPDETDDDINDLEYEPITNPTGKLLEFRPEHTPGTSWKFVQDKALILCKSTDRDIASCSALMGVDSDNQVIMTTSCNSILRFNRDGSEDERYNLKYCGLSRITDIETDDFGHTYFASIDGRVGKAFLDGQSNLLWRAGHCDLTSKDNNINQLWSSIDSISDTTINHLTYIDGKLYFAYSESSVTEYRIGQIDVETGRVYTIDYDFEPIKITEGNGRRVPQMYSACISKTNKKIYLGSTGQRVYQFNLNGTNPKVYGAVDSFDYGVIYDIQSVGHYIYAVGVGEYGEGSNPYTAYIVRYDSNNEDSQYNPIVKTFPEEIENGIKIALDPDGNCYVYDDYAWSITKYSADNFEPIWVYGRDEFKNREGSPSSCERIFVDPNDYHVYMDYYSNNNDDRHRYLELEQNDLPTPKYHHTILTDGNKSVTIYQPATSARDLSWRMPKTNRYYIGGRSGNIFTFTQSSRELTKREQDGSLRMNGTNWKTDNEAEDVFVIPDDEFNYYVIRENLVTKYNRYDRVLWAWDGAQWIGHITERMVYNPVSKDLVFFYYDTSGNHSFGKISSTGEFSEIQLTLYNNIDVTRTNCAIAVDNMGNYYLGYSAATIYRYTSTFDRPNSVTCYCYGHDTDKMEDGPVGSISIVGVNVVEAVYVTAKDDSNGNSYSKVIKYSGNGRLLWKHDFLNTSLYASVVTDGQGNVYMSDDREIRKLDTYGNYVWRFKYDVESIHSEPSHILIDEFFRVYFIDSDKSVHRIDQYDLTLSPVPDETKEPPEPTQGEEEPDIPDNYIKVQRLFDIPFDYDDTTAAMLLFTNTGQYIGNRFWELRRGKIYLKGIPIYENGWLDIVRIQNEKESVVIERR